jgi:co-chaperonin GroES (HSP10)
MIKAVWDAIIVQADEKNEKMHGKFIIPDMTQEKAIIGTIVDIGPGRWNAAGDARIPMSFTVGQKVVLSQVGPTRLEWEGVEYIAVSEANVLALIEE